MAKWNMHEKTRINISELIASFESFQRCGPALAGAMRLSGADRPVEVLGKSTDWSYITLGRPVEDCRVSELPDLVTGPRAVLRAMADLRDGVVKPKSYMSLR